MAGVQAVTVARSDESFLAGLGVPGHWWLWKGGEGNMILVCCPRCKKIIHLGEEHAVASDGTVTPSCKCPTSYCDFHAMVKLEGWMPPATKPADAERKDTSTCT